MELEETKKQITELQEKLLTITKERDHFAEGYSEERDKLHRRNLQIAEFKKRICAKQRICEWFEHYQFKGGPISSK